MGIPVEFAPDMALRNISEYKNGNRKKEECIPEKLEIGEIYPFLKSDQKNYWLYGKVPLVETKGKGVLSPPLAGVQILEATHYLDDGNIFTRGKYKVLELLDGQNISYDYFNRIGFDE
ncbi:MAG: hypothetical protein WC080_02410 [Patescibacteria group bacterium]|jgi:hypothetical protein